MKLHHRTTMEAARSILKKGFIDQTGNYLTEQKLTGVWFSDRPLDSNEGIRLDADTLLEITTRLSESALAEYEAVEDEKPYREWLVPAALINANSTTRIVDDEEVALLGV